MAEAKPQFLTRMEGLDSLRGFALLGLFLVHMGQQFDLYWLHPSADPVQQRWQYLLFDLFSGKAFAILSMCFGISFFIIMDRAARQGVDFTGRFVWRLLLLWILGGVHSLLFRDDFLQVLAVMGLLVVPFHRARSGLLVCVGILALLRPLALLQVASGIVGADWTAKQLAEQTAADQDLYASQQHVLTLMRTNLTYACHTKWSVLLLNGRLAQIFGLSLLGLWLGRIGFFYRQEKYAQARLTAFALAATAVVGLHYGKDSLLTLVSASDVGGRVHALWEEVLLSWDNLLKMVLLVLGFVIAYYGFARRALGLLAPAGRMTLTLYVGQSLVFVPLFYGFGFNGHMLISESTAIVVGLAFCAAQILFSQFWFARFLYGPLEWVWRAGTYLTVKVPMRRRKGGSPNTLGRPAENMS